MNIQDAYNEWSEIYDTDENLTRDLDQRVTRDTFEHSRFTSILEIGCGTGKNTNLLSHIGEKVYALDFSPSMLHRARTKIQAPNVCFLQADITQTWPCKDRSYDLIICNLVLEHIENLTWVFSEASRSLGANGRFYVCELHPFKQYQGKQAQFVRGNAVTTIPAFVHHVSNFVEAARDNGLKLSELREWWHENDQGEPPRLISFQFTK